MSATSDIERAITRVLEGLAADRGMSQTALAEAVGISQPQISKVFAGEKVLTVPELDRMCQALRVSIAEVIRAAEKLPPPASGASGRRSG